MEITSYFLSSHLLTPIIISLVLLILLFLVKKTFFESRKWLWVSCIVFLCVYIFLLVSAVYLSNYYQWELQKFDLDGNGLFTKHERTPQQQQALSKVTADTARNFSFITGFIIAFLIASLTYIVGRLIEYRRRKRS